MKKHVTFNNFLNILWIALPIVGALVGGPVGAAIGIAGGTAGKLAATPIDHGKDKGQVSEEE